ncbi:damage-inducible protein J [Lactobacillus sp. ESL0791]|uniref:type II toxin-antitoxin system RelB/DinJ family antitoxin n=1 Tax=Lactobacillus sp. ESL0791 TaxID=2983234 RepID=UPI0023F9C065|nr:damage-inducible protein J [Lactobacillus sp. ESL0791]MDF7638444.1 damage-inducible protein J [Lactobacillus sp. ESL0791]
MAISTTTVRMNANLKDELTKELNNIGLSVNAYFNLAAKQLVLQKKVPFEVLTETEEPSEKTKKALILAEAKELGLISDDTPEFNNVDELMKFLNK